MAIVYVINAAVTAYVATVALSLLAYGGLDYFREPDRTVGVLEAVAGGVLSLYLLVFHFKGLTRAIPRELSGPLLSKLYIVLPAVVAVVTTDYLLRRIVPLVADSGGDTTDSQADTEPTLGDRVRSRRSVLGATLGLVSASLMGGMNVLSGMLRPPIGGTDIAEFEKQTSFDAPGFPMALDFNDDYGFLTTARGSVFKFDQPSSEQSSLQFTEVASGIKQPQGVEVHGDTLYTVDNGSAGMGKYGPEKGYEMLQESNGKVVAFDIGSDGSLSNKRTVISGLPVVNRDHALHQIVTGPDGRLYLSIGHLGGQKYSPMFENGSYAPSEEDHPNFEYLGTVISFAPDGSDIEIVASGLRNVYDLSFDQQGNLFGANNDGMSVQSRVWESLYHITDGADFGYPEYGTFDSSPDDVDVTDPIWTLSAPQSTGIETTDAFGIQDGVVVGIKGKVVFVPIEQGDNGVFVPDFLRPEPTVIDMNDSPIIVEAGPNGLLWVSTRAQQTLTLWEV